ncbi:glycine zipper 2TM domain-containing protein [Sphingomonas sp. RT2P30]|uniref:glycine zipper 2TM domain-containing protein n=1 Tax=Parasphingomonas halimpatiens TaxID=3096162 RepID=UPI002FC698A5
MKRFTTLATIVATGCMALASPSFAQSARDDARFDAAQRRFQNELSLFQQEFDRYQQARAANRGGGGYYDSRQPPQQGYLIDDRDESGYDASRYYRPGPNYQERTLSNDDRIYRGTDGRYYCKRNDGTTGLVLGAVGGGILGNVIDGGHSRAVGTLLGGALGAIAGQALDRNSAQIRCR